MFYEAPINVIPYVLEMASCLNVTLLMFLRLVAIQFPLSYHTTNRVKLRRIFIAVIWIVSILSQILPVAILYCESKNVYFYVRLTIVHCCGTLPVIAIVIMNALLLWTVNKKQKMKRPSEQLPAILNPSSAISESISRKMNLLVQKVVTFLLVCYVPYLTWAHYFYAVIIQRTDSEISEFEVNIMNKKIPMHALDNPISLQYILKKIKMSY